jgi:hypothetical protein
MDRSFAPGTPAIELALQQRRASEASAAKYVMGYEGMLRACYNLSQCTNRP